MHPPGRAVSACVALFVKEAREGELTVAEEAMQLIASQEGQPAYAVALILPQLDANVDRNLVLGDLATVQQLHQEFALEIALGQKLGRKPWRIGKTGLCR